MVGLDGISVFVEVVEANGFSAAAARLNLTRSPIALAKVRQLRGVAVAHTQDFGPLIGNDSQVAIEHRAPHLQWRRETGIEIE